MEEDRLLHRADERVADPAEHGVEGPDGEVVLSSLRKCAGVGDEVLLRIPGIDAERLGSQFVHPPVARRYVLR